ncbi:hypothetical protein [Streptomyces poonensis]|uniref:Uncharacterized protein n=1 Tax=Streptomyces poonensis TaxID=68255 RepID=A0A918UH01_9ACTN|nr:hypothetical protein [Streptomyces poonensis]GGZ07905.1 hypothetical protein GCM10010365_28810 [Streptomyces poonensis]GLJ88492.1 hypothetical protein GCM10017589_10920 [Streptomyces poonensis]
MNVIRLRRRAREADRPVAAVLGTVDALLSCVLFWMLIGSPLFVETTTREQETAAQFLGLQIFGCWLVGGLVLFSVLGMTRTVLSHLAAMLLTPVALVLMLLVS